MEQEMTKAIMAVRKRVSREEWRKRILECQRSGLPVRKWCAEKGVSPGSYYTHLREFREETLTDHQFVPVGNAALAGEIQVEGSGIRVMLPGDASPEQIRAVITALKPC